VSRLHLDRSISVWIDAMLQTSTMLNVYGQLPGESDHFTPWRKLVSNSSTDPMYYVLPVRSRSVPTDGPVYRTRLVRHGPRSALALEHTQSKRVVAATRLTTFPWTADELHQPFSHVLLLRGCTFLVDYMFRDVGPWATGSMTCAAGAFMW
jgi:hypothetical protein